MKFITAGNLNRFWKNGIKPIKDKVDELNTDLSELITIGTYTNSTVINIAANSSATINGAGDGIDLSTYVTNGYKAIGVSSFIMTSQGVLYSRIQVENNKLWYQLQNLNNSTVTIPINGVSIRLLCVKVL